MKFQLGAYMECADALKMPQAFTTENRLSRNTFYQEPLPLPQVIVEKRPYM